MRRKGILYQLGCKDTCRLNFREVVSNPYDYILKNGISILSGRSFHRLIKTINVF